MAEACKRLIKNCIICWNYLYLSQKLEKIEDAASRQVFLDAVAHGSVISWQHINLLGEYDFSDEKLRDSVGIRPQKLTPKAAKNLGGCRIASCASVTGTRRKTVWDFTYLCWNLTPWQTADASTRRM